MVDGDDRLAWISQLLDPNLLCFVLTFSGMCSPRIVLPPVGVILGRPAGTGGYTRNASLRQANM